MKRVRQRWLTALPCGLIVLLLVWWGWPGGPESAPRPQASAPAAVTAGVPRTAEAPASAVAAAQPSAATATPGAAMSEIEAALTRLGVTPQQAAAELRTVCGQEHIDPLRPDPVPFAARRLATQQQLWAGLQQGSAREQALGLALHAQTWSLDEAQRAGAQAALVNFALSPAGQGDPWIVSTAIRQACIVGRADRCHELIQRRSLPAADAAGERWAEELFLLSQLGDSAGAEAALQRAAAASRWSSGSGEGGLPVELLLASNAYAGLSPPQRIAVLSDWMLGPAHNILQRPPSALLASCRLTARGAQRTYLRRAQCDAVTELMQRDAADEWTLRIAQMLAGELRWDAARMAELSRRVKAANVALSTLAVQAATGPCTIVNRLEQLLRDASTRGAPRALEADQARQAAASLPTR